MQHEKCLNCERLGTSCNCMSFVKMSSRELIEWCKAKKSLLKMTNDTLAHLSGVPVGTINRIFAGKGNGYYYETLQPIIKALIAGNWSADNCANIQDMGELTEHARETIARLEAERDFLKHETESIRNQAQKEIALLLPLLKFRKHAIIVLSVLLCIALTAIIGALIIDRINPNKGFFWLS